MENKKACLLCGQMKSTKYLEKKMLHGQFDYYFCTDCHKSESEENGKQ
jgi:hypothetical protein